MPQQDFIVALSQLNGGMMFIASVAYLVAYLGADKDTRTILGALAVLGQVRSLLISDLYQTFRVNRVYGVMVPFLRLLILLIGVRQNVGTSLWSPGGPFELRNAMFITMVQTVFFWTQSKFFWTAFLHHWMPASKAAAFSSMACHTVHQWYLVLVVGNMFVSWCAWVQNQREVIRGLTLAMIGQKVLESVWAYFVRAEHGFSNSSLLQLIAINLSIALYAAIALHREVNGRWAEYIRSVFQWSYEPIKGGAYTHILYLLTVGAIVFLKPDWLVARYAQLPHVNGWQTSELETVVTTFGLHTIITGLNLYIATRVADHSFSKLITASAVLGHILYWSIAYITRNNVASGALEVMPSDALLVVPVLLTILSSLYYNYWHEGAVDEKVKIRQNRAQSPVRSRGRRAAVAVDTGFDQ